MEEYLKSLTEDEYRGLQLVARLKDPDYYAAFTHMDFDTFLSIQKEIEKREYMYCCANNPDHDVIVVSRGTQWLSAKTGKVVDTDTHDEDAHCVSCTKNISLVDSYLIDDFMGLKGA